MFVLILRVIFLNSGMNFVIACLEMIIGYTLWAFVIEDKITDSFAMSIAIHLWLVTIPIYGLSWVFLWLFYNKEHAWKSKGVIVGFEFDNELVEEENKVWQRNMVGRWIVPYPVNKEISLDDIEERPEVEHMI